MSTKKEGVVFVQILNILVDFWARDAILYTLRERTKTKTPRVHGFEQPVWGWTARVPAISRYSKRTLTYVRVSRFTTV